VCTEPLNLENDKYLALLSEPAKNLLHGMLAKEASQRLTIDQVLAHEWLN
jgi:serine/threonine protein kinase